MYIACNIDNISRNSYFFSNVCNIIDMLANTDNHPQWNIEISKHTSKLEERWVSDL